MHIPAFVCDVCEMCASVRNGKAHTAEHVLLFEVHGRDSKQKILRKAFQRGIICCHQKLRRGLRICRVLQLGENDLLRRIKQYEIRYYRVAECGQIHSF